jgi:hypothetical protein
LLIISKGFTKEKKGSSPEEERYAPLTSQIRRAAVSIPALEYAIGVQVLEPSFPKLEKNYKFFPQEVRYNA